MRIEEFFGDWGKVVDMECARQTLVSLLPQAKCVCPKLRDVFKAFQCCDYNSLRVVIIGKEPYNSMDYGVSKATGIAFANSKETPKWNYSPYLEKLRASVIDYSVPHDHIIFDPSLKKWEEQGVLLLNMALTTIENMESCHTELWRPFMSSLLKRLSINKTGIVYVLLGSDVYLALKDYISPVSNYILPVFNPSFFLPPSLWKTINQLLINQNGYGIDWYEEYSEQENQERHSEGVQGSDLQEYPGGEMCQTIG